MTAAVLTIPCTAKGCVKLFHLGAHEDLNTRINSNIHALGLQFMRSNDHLVLKDNGIIPLHKLLNWINLMGYQLRSTMIFETNTGYYNGKSCYEKYVFEKVLG